MEKSRANTIIVSILQNALAGKIKLDSSINPQHIADAIEAKVIFEKSYTDTEKDKVVGNLIETIISKKEEMEKELQNTSEDQHLLKNYLHGKISAYMEILNAIDNI